ncbi:hypothetical protein [Saccharopolyspora sp. NPDC049357]|uniref:hypothetical protein n=1 Tax=Saccharopolyspora sp. NPDC049357 TaxID=3154507 RepID=UPI0034413F84
MGSSHDDADLRAAQSNLLLDAAAVMRRRYVRGNDGGTSPNAAEALANVLEGVARAEPALHQIDRDEAIALAHRLVDDDHPELSRMWPA